MAAIAMMAAILPLTATGEPTIPMKEGFHLTSSAFGNQENIPRAYTCEGDDASPPLAWGGAPHGTRSFALVVDDPDAPDPSKPQRTWVHWVLYNIPAAASALPEGLTTVPNGAIAGTNDWKRQGYGGPCPPVGRHRYFHKLYALDVVLPDLGHMTKRELELAMAGHVLAAAELVGLYQKGQGAR